MLGINSFSPKLTKNQFESSLISQRVKAGMARTKAQDRHIARPP